MKDDKKSKETRRRKLSSLVNMRVQVGRKASGTRRMDQSSRDFLSTQPVTLSSHLFPRISSKSRPYLSLSCETTLKRTPAVSTHLNLRPVMSTSTVVTLNREHRHLTCSRPVPLPSLWSPSPCPSPPSSWTWRGSASLTSWESKY